MRKTIGKTNNGEDNEEDNGEDNEEGNELDDENNIVISVGLSIDKYTCLNHALSNATKNNQSFQGLYTLGCD